MTSQCTSPVLSSQLRRIEEGRFVMELSSTLRDVRDALDRLDEALHRENILIASTKDSISDSKAKEANLNEQIQVDLVEYVAAQQRREDIQAILDNSTVRQDPHQSERQTKDEIDGIRTSLVQEAKSFLKECVSFEAQFSETGFANKEKQILESQQEANAKHQEAEKKNEALLQQDANLDHQLHQWKDAFVQTLNEHKSLQESIRNFNHTTPKLTLQNQQDNNARNVQTIQLRQSLTEIENEVSRLKLSLSNRQKELQTLEAEKTRLKQSVAASKARSYPPKTQDRKKKQSGNDREINKRPRSDPIDEEASIERDLFGGIRHHHF